MFGQLRQNIDNLGKHIEMKAAGLNKVSVLAVINVYLPQYF